MNLRHPQAPQFTTVALWVAIIFVILIAPLLAALATSRMDVSSDYTSPRLASPEQMQIPAGNLALLQSIDREVAKLAQRPP